MLSILKIALIKKWKKYTFASKINASKYMQLFLIIQIVLQNWCKCKRKCFGKRRYEAITERHQSIKKSNCNEDEQI